MNERCANQTASLQKDGRLFWVSVLFYLTFAKPGKSFAQKVSARAVVNLSGTQNRKFITDANGNYHFDNVETSGFYTVRPSSANYSFSPAERSFSQIGNATEAAFTGTPAAARAAAQPKQKRGPVPLSHPWRRFDFTENSMQARERRGELCILRK